MRVLEVHEPPVGGVAEHIRLLAVGLHRGGVEVEVAGPPQALGRDWLLDQGVRCHPLPDIVGDMVAWRLDAATFRRLAGIIVRGRFDVVHAHGLKASLLVRLIAPPLRIPVVYTPHSLIHRHHFAYTGATSPQYRKTLLLERVLGRVTAAIIGCCRQERDWAVEDGLIAPERSITILNGVDVDTTIAPDPQLLEFAAGGPLLGYVGILRRGKGLSTLLEALELLSGNGRAVRFAIVGNGPIAAEIAAQVRSGPLAATTLVAPYNGRMEPYLRAIDALVLASRAEGLPLAILEAMSLGVPPLASAVGGVPEVVRDGENGLLVPPADAAALAAAIERLVADGELRRRLAASALRDGLRLFTADRMVKETLAVYERYRR